MAQSIRTRILGVACMVAASLSSFAALANNLQSVKVSQGQDNNQVVRITTTEALAALPIHFTTANPHRIVLDFAGLQNPLGRQSETVNTGVVRAYNVAQAGDRTRVVVDLNGPATYDVRKEKNVLLVALRGSATTPGTATPTHFNSASTGSAFNIRDVAFKRGKNGEGRIEVALSDPGVGIDIKQKGAAIQVDFLNASLPQPLQRRLDVSEFATPAQTIETFAQGKDTRMVVTPKGKWDFFAYQTGKSFILEVTSLEAGGQQPEKARYEGEKLSLDFQNVEVRAVLKVIADFTGLNIITADSVSGNVTIRLKDVPWDQALDIILRAKGLDKRVNGNVIWVEQADALLKKEESEKRSRRSNEALEELLTRNYRLNYIRADEAMTILSGSSRSTGALSETATCSPSATGIKAEASAAGAATNASSRQSTGQGPSGDSNWDTTWATNRVLSPRGAASFDLTTNTLIVTDIADRHAKIEEVLKGIDLPSKQVMIEARVVIADDSFGRHLGARLGFQTLGEFNGTNVGVAPGGLIDVDWADVEVPHSLATAARGLHVGNSYNIDLPTSQFGVSAPSLGFTLINAASETLLNLELQALEADSRGKIISNPKVITTNLRAAVILQGEQIPVVTPGSANSPATTTFKDALLCLLVAPQVLNNDDIIMNVEVTKDARGDVFGDNVAVNVKRVKTQVRVKNGETAVLGGVFEEDQRNQTNKVPVLGDVPLLGVFFRNNAKTDVKREMLIFLTPRILQ
jgi:type IV pilus assembly protein PilQ